MRWFKKEEVGEDTQRLISSLTNRKKDFYIVEMDIMGGTIKDSVTSDTLMAGTTGMHLNNRKLNRLEHGKVLWELKRGYLYD